MGSKGQGQRQLSVQVCCWRCFQGLQGVPVCPATSEALKRHLNSRVMSVKEKSGAQGRQIQLCALAF